MSNSKVQEVFGKFAVEINGKVELFDTRAEAASAEVMATNSAEFEARAKAYTDGIGLDTEEKAKVAKTRQNVVIEFLAYEASLAGEEEAVAVEADADSF